MPALSRQSHTTARITGPVHANVIPLTQKFLKKGFETYVLWSDGDADEEPIAILTNFFKAMACLLYTSCAQ